MAKRLIRFFNTTGPCNPDDHYMLPPEERLIGAQLHRYVRDKLYWVLHAPRQTGKTTFLQSWMREINSGDEAIACYVSVERSQGFITPKESMPLIREAIREHAGWNRICVPELSDVDPGNMLSSTLSNWASKVAPKPLIVLFDEVDVLEGESMISFLRQLRGGFAEREVGVFPVSIALVGMRDLKDYITKSKGGVAPNPGSPFNIKEDSAVIGNFSKADIVKLFAQHTTETGQLITEEALNYVWEQSKGQPWIVNNLFKRATMRVLESDDYSTVTDEHVFKAREQMIMARETHLDSLAYRLENPEVRRIIETIITGEFNPNIIESEGFRIVIDLGLVSMGSGNPEIANPIYREVIARQITYSTQVMLQKPNWKWKKDDGTLDMDALLREFQYFWKMNSEELEEMSNYTEAFPHILLMAFLQRVTNGDGRVERDYAAGSGRMDLAVEYNGRWDIIEVKLWRKYRTYDYVLKEGLKQIRRYKDHFAPISYTKDPSTTGSYLLIFNRRPEAKEMLWEERLGWEQEDDITVVRC